MRIVTRTQLMALPAGTLYHETVPCIFKPLCIKGETDPDPDFNNWRETMLPEILGPDDEGYEAMERGESVPIDFQLEGWESLWNNELRYAVWEQQDVDAFVAELRRRGAYKIP